MLHSSSNFHSLGSSDTIFGVKEEVYYVEENAGYVRVCVQLVDGCLQRNVYIECKKLGATAKSA